MTDTQNSLRKLKEKRDMVNNLLDNIQAIEGELSGVEIDYNGHYAVAVCVDVMNDYILIYVGEEEGTDYEVDMTVEEFEGLLR